MVSELVLLRPASVPTDDGFYVRVGPCRKKETMVSDLKDFINLRFNFPCPQVLVGEEGGVVITGLYEGIPDDADYNHEAFDHIIDLVGWIEGCVELPSASKEKGSDYEQLTESLVVEEISNQTAHQLLVELPKPVDINKRESTEQEESDQLESTVAKEILNLAAYQVLDKMLESKTDLNALEEVSFDPGGISSIDLAQNSEMIDDDDVLTAKRLIIDDDAVNQDGKLVRIEATDASKVEVETANSVAQQVFDKMIESPQQLKRDDSKALKLRIISDAKGDSINLMNKNLDDAHVQNELMVPTMELSFDPGGQPNAVVKSSDVMKTDGVLANGVLEVDDTLTQHEERAQVVINDEPAVEKEVVYSAAHQVFGQIPKPMTITNMEWWVKINKKNVVESFDDHLATEITQDKVMMFCFDPGGAFQSYVFDEFPQSANTSEIEHTDELLKDNGENGKYIQPLSSKGKPYNLTISEVCELMGVTISLLTENKFARSIKHLNDLLMQRNFKKDYVEVQVCFNPGIILCLDDFTKSFCAMCLTIGAEFADFGSYLGAKYKKIMFESAKENLQKCVLICNKMRRERGFSTVFEIIIAKMASKAIYGSLQTFNRGVVNCQLLKHLHMKRGRTFGFLREMILILDQHAITCALTFLSPELVRKGVLSCSQSGVEMLASLLGMQFDPGGTCLRFKVMPQICNIIILECFSAQALWMSGCSPICLDKEIIWSLDRFFEEEEYLLTSDVFWIYIVLCAYIVFIKIVTSIEIYELGNDVCCAETSLIRPEPDDVRRFALNPGVAGAVDQCVGHSLTRCSLLLLQLGNKVPVDCFCPMYGAPSHVGESINLESVPGSMECLAMDDLIPLSHNSAWNLTDYDFRKLKCTWSSIHLCAGTFIFDPGGECLMQRKLLESIFIYTIPAYSFLLALASPLNMSKSPRVKRKLLQHIFVMSASTISASHYRALNVQILDEYMLGILTSAGFMSTSFLDVFPSEYYISYKEQGVIAYFGDGTLVFHAHDWHTSSQHAHFKANPHDTHVMYCARSFIVSNKIAHPDHDPLAELSYAVPHENYPAGGEFLNISAVSSKIATRIAYDLVKTRNVILILIRVEEAQSSMIKPNVQDLYQEYSRIFILCYAMLLKLFWIGRISHQRRP